MAERASDKDGMVLTPEYFLQEKQFNIWDCFSEQRSNFNNRLHFHEFYELSIVYEGGVRFLINGSEVFMGVKHLQLIRPADYHSQMAEEGEYIRYYNLMFSADFLTEPLLREIEASPGPLCAVASDGDWKKILCLVQQMFEESAGKKEDLLSQISLRCSLELICLFILRNQSPLARKPTETMQEPIRRALVYIQKNYRSPISLSDAALVAGLSPSYFSTLFHATIGTTFSAYLIGYRLQIAERYLRSNMLSVKQIAAVCGFPSYPYFVSAFKVQYGVSPGRWRSQNRLQFKE